MSAEGTAVVWTPGDLTGETLGDAARAAGRADVVVVMPGVKVYGDWLERLVGAAHSDTTIATASAMVSGGPWAPSPLPAGELGGTAGIVAEHSARRRPRIAEPVAGCLVIRRTALDVVGSGEESWSLPGGIADFGERCTAVGLGHVLADDVLAEGVASAPSEAEAAVLEGRYPHRTRTSELDGGGVAGRPRGARSRRGASTGCR